MKATDVRRAIAAVKLIASDLDLPVDDAIVLSDSNRLVIRLMPCDTVARVTPLTHFASAEQEVELVKQLAQTDSPVAPLEPRVEPRVFVRDGFKITLWAHLEPAQSRVLPPAEYAQALAGLHAGLRRIEVATPHFMDRVAATQRDVANRDVTPDLADTDRALLANTLHELGRSIVSRRGAVQVLHGEPHPMNILTTKDGPLFIDFENTARGPVEYDLAWVPTEVSRHYPNADQDVVDECRGVVLAIVATHRWSLGDQHPSGRESGVAFLRALRDGPPWPALDDVVW
ncbi:phosphotransferase [Kribbella sp. NPDC051587]|uniref:phosphotransferase n=1 Tax=Kribbella sp. NPDC051587 TaxID=3364119 RepID=UPI0037A27343